MNRSRTGALGLKHLAFFEAVGESEANSSKAYAATAGLLMLRLIDHWILAGPVMVEPESVSVRSVRNAIMQLETRDPSREILLGLINTMQTVREVDMQPVLPRLFAYAGCLEKRVELTLAADVYATIARLGEEEFDGDLLIDSFLRLGYCQRAMGTLNEAEASYALGGKIAKRQKDRSRELHAQVGVANVVIARGNLPAADELLARVVSESEAADCFEAASKALHGRSVVAQRKGDLDQAVCLAYGALQRTTLPSERDRILADIGGYLIALERFDAARDALMILEATATSEIVRRNTGVNMVALAARSGDRELFATSVARMHGVALASEAEVNYLIESARGYREFGEPERARTLLSEALAIATKSGFNRSVFEVEAMLVEGGTVVEKASGGSRHEKSEAAANVEQELHAMALAVS